MKTCQQIYFTLAFLFSFSILNAQVTFYKVYQNGDNDSQVFDIAALTTGGYAMVGIAGNDSGVSEVALTKLGCDGEIEWAKKYGNSSTVNNVFSTVIEADNGDIIMINNVGSFQDYDFIIVRVTPAGDTVWKKRYGGNRDDAGRSIIQTIDGNLVITGGTGNWGTDDSGSLSYSDVHLLKVDADNGDVIWSKTYGNGAAIDAGYAITEDAGGNLFSTGRFLVGGTFYSYILKTDSDGDVLMFKGFGAPNHRTYGYDIEVTTDGNIVLTGSTTINKEDHTSFADVFLIKTNAEGMPYFTNIYYPWVGEDRSESGSSLVLQDDGGYGIGVPTMSFTNWSSGFVPNKNAVYSIASDGNIDAAYLYNQGGSHYTRLRKDIDGGYILSNFSNFFGSGFEFIPLVVKMDASYEGGCNRINVSSELEVAFEDWDIQDITYTEDTGHAVTNFSPESDFSYSFIDIQCELVPSADASFDVAPSSTEPAGTFDFTNTSLSPGSYQWDFDDGTSSAEENPSHSFSATGMYNVCLTLFANCDEVEVCQTVNVDEVHVNVSELSSSPYRVFPNPIQDKIFLHAPDNFYGLKLLEIYSIEGKLLYQEDPAGKLHQSQISIDVKGLISGMYYLKVHFEDKVYSQKVVK